jgi:hypothetical protein
VGERCVITYDGAPTYSVSIIEFANEHVVHETQFFCRSFRGTGLAGSARGADAGPEHHPGLSSARIQNSQI